MRRRVDEGGVAVVVGVLHQLYLVVKVVMLAAVCVDGSFELISTPRGIGQLAMTFQAIIQIDCGTDILLVIV